MNARIRLALLLAAASIGLLFGCASGFPVLSGGPPQIHYVLQTEPVLDTVPESTFLLSAVQASDSVALDEVDQEGLQMVVDTLNSDIVTGLTTFGHAVEQTSLPLSDIATALEGGELPEALQQTELRYWITAIVDSVSRDSAEMQLRFKTEYEVPVLVQTVGPGGIPQIRSTTRTETDTSYITHTREWFNVEMTFVVYDSQANLAVIRTATREQPISGSASVKGYGYPSEVRPIMESIEPHEYAFSEPLEGSRTRDERLREAHRLAATVGPNAAFRLYQEVWVTDKDHDAGFNAALIMLQEGQYDEAYAVLQEMRDLFPEDPLSRTQLLRLEAYIFPQDGTPL